MDRETSRAHLTRLHPPRTGRFTPPARRSPDARTHANTGASRGQHHHERARAPETTGPEVVRLPYFRAGMCMVRRPRCSHISRAQLLSLSFGSLFVVDGDVDETSAPSKRATLPSRTQRNNTETTSKYIYGSNERAIISVPSSVVVLFFFRFFRVTLRTVSNRFSVFVVSH